MRTRLAFVALLALLALALAVIWVAFLEFLGLRPGTEPLLFFQITLLLAISFVARSAFARAFFVILVWFEAAEGPIAELPSKYAHLVVNTKRGRRVLSVPTEIEMAVGQMVTKRRFSTRITINGQSHSLMIQNAKDFASVVVVMAFILLVALFTAGIAALLAPRHGV
jgi:hypothetical protein